MDDRHRSAQSSPDLPPDPVAQPDPAAQPDLEVQTVSGGRPEPGTPRWVKVFGIVLATAVLLILAAALFGGDHGPARHTPAGGPPLTGVGR